MLPLLRGLNPHHACLLLALFASPAVPAWADESQTVTVNVLAAGGPAGRASGSCTPLNIWHERKPGIGFQMAFIVDEIDGQGDEFQAAGWQAALMAADLSGRDTTDLRFFMQRSGRIDGASAGGLTTVGMIAALRGDTVRPDAAMTGTINPDGTIGPVGAIPHKIDAAAEAGMKLVLIPYGMRTDHDKNLGRDVDLFDRGADKGVEVRAVGDIFAAYRLLTGSDLPRVDPAPAPSLPNDVYKRVKLKVDEWLVRYRDQLAEYNRVPERYRSDYCEELVELAAAAVAEIDKLLEQGQAPMAYLQAYTSAINMAIASQIGRTEWVDAQRGRKDAVEYAAKFAQIDSKLRLAADRLRVQKPKTLAQAGSTIYAYTTLTEAICYRDLGDLLIRGGLEIPLQFEVEDEAEGQMEQILTGVEYMLIAEYNCLLLEDSLEIAGQLGGKPLPESLPLAATTEFFRRAALADLNQFEQIVVATAAESRGISMSKMRWLLMLEDESYLVARWGAAPAREKLVKLFEGDALAYAKLGLAIHTYSLSSSLLARYYSLGSQFDEEGMLTGVRREASLKYMLDFAEDQTRRNIQLLRSKGLNPWEIVFDYQAAGALRSGETWEKLDALEWLWESNMITRTIAHLGGLVEESSHEDVSPPTANGQ